MEHECVCSKEQECVYSKEHKSGFFTMIMHVSVWTDLTIPTPIMASIAASSKPLDGDGDGSPSTAGAGAGAGAGASGPQFPQLHQFHNADPKAAQVGDVLACIEYYHITEVQANGALCLATLPSLHKPTSTSTVAASVIANEFYSVRVSEEHVVTRTQVQLIIEQQLKSMPFRAVFRKKVTQKQITDKLQAWAENCHNPTRRQLSALARELMLGERREMVGTCKMLDPGTGRMVVREVCTVKGGACTVQERLMDLRTIEALDVGGVGYRVKGTQEGTAAAKRVKASSAPKGTARQKRPREA